MAQMAQGIVGGEMPWALILFGMAFATALILIKAPRRCSSRSACTCLPRRPRHLPRRLPQGARRVARAPRRRRRGRSRPRGEHGDSRRLGPHRGRVADRGAAGRLVLTSGDFSSIGGMIGLPDRPWSRRGGSLLPWCRSPLSRGSSCACRSATPGAEEVSCDGRPGRRRDRAGHPRRHRRRPHAPARRPAATDRDENGFEVVARPPTARKPSGSLAICSRTCSCSTWRCRTSPPRRTAGAVGRRRLPRTLLLSGRSATASSPKRSSSARAAGSPRRP